jgi:hypothetical protein
MAAMVLRLVTTGTAPETLDTRSTGDNARRQGLHAPHIAHAEGTQAVAPQRFLIIVRAIPPNEHFWGIL